MAKFPLLVLAALALATSVGPTRAQVPDLGGALGNALPSLPALGQTVQGLDETASRSLRAVRETAARTLRREHRDVIDADRAGNPVIRSQIVALAPSPQALEAARARGFTVAETLDASALELTVVVLRAPAGMSTRRALETLQASDPEGAYDYDHIYLGAGAHGSRPIQTLQSSGQTGGGSGARIGLIDSGVDARHPALAHANLQQRGFAGDLRADVHGTEVASLIVGDHDGFRGAAPDASLYVADVYGARPTGGGASAIVQALAWLAQSRVGVINISLVGPPNRALEAAVRGAIAHGCLVVAAVGNDGPSAPPLYPGAYAGVIGVTGVDGANRVLPEAGRGAQVDFAAPGGDMRAASPGQGYAAVRGTSFAAPIVAGLLARHFASADAGGQARAQASLAQSARDLGARGRDPVYGAGFVGGEVRSANRQVARR